MKKFLLSLMALLSVGCMAFAETYTFNGGEISGTPGTNRNFVDANGTFVAGGFKFTALKNSGTTEPTYNGKNGDIRIYAKNTLEIAANGAKITGISFEISAQGLKRLTDVTPSVGAIEEQGTNPLLWNGNAAAVTFTIGDKATYGTEGAEKAGQFDFITVTITTDGPVTDFDAPVIDRTAIDELSQVYACENNELFTMGIDLTVAYANGAYVYVYSDLDGPAFGLIYKSGLNLETGQVIEKGWNGHISIYNGLCELVPDDALTTNGTATVAPVDVTPANVASTLTASNQNMYVRLTEVAFAAATPAADATKDEEGNDLREFTGMSGDTEVTFYQRFGVDSVEPGTYAVVGFISVYKEKVQINPISFTDLSGINSVEASVEAPVYYNMQGVKVENPRQGGLYIRVANGAATKVVK